MFAFILLQLPIKAQFPPNWQRNTHYTTALPSSDWRTEVLTSGLCTRFITSSLPAPFNHCWASVGYSLANMSSTPVLAELERLTVQDAEGNEIINTATGYTADLTNYYRSFGTAIAECKHALGYGYATGGTLRGLGAAAPTSGPFDGYVGRYDSDGTFQVGTRLHTTGNDNVTDVTFAPCSTCREPYAVYACGNSILAGATLPFVSTLNPNTGAMEWTKHFKFSFGGTPLDVEISSITPLGGGRMALAGKCNDPLLPTKDAIVFVLSGAGTLVWVQRYGEAATNEEFRSIAYSLDSPTTLICAGNSEFGGIKKLWMTEINLSTGTLYNSRLLTYGGISTDPSSSGNVSLEGIEVKKVIGQGVYIVSCKTKIDAPLLEEYNAIYIMDKEFTPLQFTVLNRVSAAGIPTYNSGVDYKEYTPAYWAFASFSNLVEIVGDRPRQGSIITSTENLQSCNYTSGTMLEYTDYTVMQEAGTAVETSTMLATELKGVQFGMNSMTDCVPYRLAATSTTTNKSVRIEPNPVSEQILIVATKPIATIRIINTVGNTVLEQRCNSASKIELRTTTLSVGTYLVEVQYEDGSRSVEKISKQ